MTYIGTLYLLPFSREYEIHIKDSNEVFWGKVAPWTEGAALSLERLEELATKVCYATFDRAWVKGKHSPLLLNAEEYDHAEEYYRAEVSLYGKCSGCHQSGAAVVVWEDGLCSSCRAEERRECDDSYDEDDREEES